MSTHIDWWMRVYGFLVGFGLAYWLRTWLANRDKKGGE